MTEEQFKQILELHTLACKLKTTLKRGWVLWHLENERIESVADHIFGTCMLAIGIFSTTKSDLDINKVVTMLMLHETEEILIGDITLVDKEVLTKKEKGRLFLKFLTALKILHIF